MNRLVDGEDDRGTQWSARRDNRARCPMCDYPLLRIFASYFCSNCRELIQPVDETQPKSH